ncbi:nicotinate phosphoribosyltransferase [Aliikangiella coralliicola]|uniref:Nicotinate phosphoribosyltransferase n=1 Tax=Aliikangiella coralliicola TaxID=2592383 RepID=A0A545UEW7_9GAMM|nr:nicotinate phosphoribosyltransferase [Aliikangiella coralliicola]TQV87985.1 nicotinate phosphoribosyltransferase [Aliikangiella coralliicola]
MANKPVIQSLLDTDLYKLSMMQVVLHHYPAAEVEYLFKCRTEGADLASLATEIRDEISHLCQLRFTENEIHYLNKIYYLKSDFVQFLKLFRLNENYVRIGRDEEGQLEIKVVGPWLHTILFEVPILAIVEEVYNRHFHADVDLKVGQRRLMEKTRMIKEHPMGGQLKLMEFGTRRRFGRRWQKQVLEHLNRSVPDNLVGTSNVYYAREIGLMPLGTMAHEYLQAFQALGPRLVDSQKAALDVWAKEYRGDLGIALTDVVGIDAFLRDFDRYFAKLFDGVRHDSGCPFEWGNKVIEHYQKLGIDTRTKSLVFSDGLDIPLAFKILAEFGEKTNVVFGIGTNLTNDVGVKPLSIVMKMVKCNGQPVAKISDSPGKTMCKDEAYLTYLRNVFELS